MESKKISLTERRKKLRLGMPSDDTFPMLLVKKSANLPIETFFQGQPETLSELRREITDLIEYSMDDTYEEVAALIHEMITDESNQERGIKMMMLLAEPYLQEFERRWELYEKTTKRKN